MTHLCWICSDKSRHLLNKMLGGKIDPRWEEHSKCGRDFPSIPCILPPLFLLCLEPDVLPPFDHLVQLLCSLFSNLPFHHFPVIKVERAQPSDKHVNLHAEEGQDEVPLSAVVLHHVVVVVHHSLVPWDRSLVKCSCARAKWYNVGPGVWRMITCWSACKFRGDTANISWKRCNRPSF